MFDEYKKDTGFEKGTVVRVGPGILDKVGERGRRWIVGALAMYIADPRFLLFRHFHGMGALLRLALIRFPWTW